MGCFSWMRADKTTKRSNIVDGDSYKILIPKEFGGGFIKDHYQGYGRVLWDTKDNMADLYGILAYWNIRKDETTSSAENVRNAFKRHFSI